MRRWAKAVIREPQNPRQQSCIVVFYSNIARNVYQGNYKQFSSSSRQIRKIPASPRAIFTAMRISFSTKNMGEHRQREEEKEKDIGDSSK
uniref:Uncharacterized protein n=1 Tax=Vespula pensylvanica TaxID=30213 RepID=A0A834PEY4_VESPE|nr:hypothetical protein H0235_001022 [Vespula pensylvanica]